MQWIAHQRLFRQALIDSPFQTPLAVVSHLGAMQAQDYPAAVWAVGLRLPGATAATVEQPIRGHQIVRTWLMRGTLHFAATEDVGWMLDLFAPGAIAGHARRNRELRLDEATLARSSALIQDAVRGGQPKTRRELFAMLDADGLESANQRGVYMLVRASYEGLVAQTVQTGRDPVFFALYELLPDRKPIPRSEALAKLARRYCTGHGPATLRDFVWWSGLRVAEARAGLEAVKPELEADTVNGDGYWRSPSLEVSGPPHTTTAWLLPAYDEFLIGYQDRSASLATEHAARVKNANGLGATVVYGGQVIGTWTRESKRTQVVIHAEPFAPWPDAVRAAVEDAVTRYGAFIGQAAALNIQS